MHLHNFIEVMANHFGYQPTSLGLVTGMDQLGSLTPIRQRLLGFIYQAPVTRDPGGSLRVNILGVRISQLETGHLEIQQMEVSQERLKKLNDQFPRRP